MSSTARRRTRREFGWVRQFKSGRWQASYLDPITGARILAPATFANKTLASDWLNERRSEIARGEHESPDVSPLTFGEYVEQWLDSSEHEQRTREHYRSLLDARLLPTFQRVALREISSDVVRRWYAQQKQKHSTPTMTSHAYVLLHTVMSAAVEDQLVKQNPVHIKGAGTVKTKRKVRPATLDQLAIIVESMPEKYRLLTLLAAWSGLRFGELTELRRSDVDLDKGVLRVRRGVVRTKASGRIVKSPKSDAGVRDVAIPPHLLPMLREHLSSTITGGRDGLLFPSAGDPQRHLAQSTLAKSYYPARAKAGRDDLRWHDLRHTGATLAAQAGATLRELMQRIGHSTPYAALIYQHVAEDRDVLIAARLSEIAESHARMS